MLDGFTVGGPFSHTIPRAMPRATVSGRGERGGRMPATRYLRVSSATVTQAASTLAHRLGAYLDDALEVLDHISLWPLPRLGAMRAFCGGPTT